jgi:hypothetical protein
MPKAREPASYNPAFAKGDMGVTANHSSTVPSTDHSENTDHSQWDDAISDQADSEDPNISGMKETAACYPWIAGKLDSWKENDDYREYFERSIGCDGMLVCYDGRDNDYDDNGGYPLAIGESRGVAGAYQSPETRRSNAEQSYGIGVVVTRRL